MNIYFKLILITFTFGICLLTLGTNTARAESLSLKIKPTTLQIRASASADIRVPFVITNQTDSIVPTLVVVKRFQATKDNDGKIQFTKPDLNDEKQKDNFLKNIQVIDNGFITDGLTLSPKQEKKLELRITIPKNSPPQDHYFTLVFLGMSDNQNSAGSSKETTISTQLGITLPVLLSIGKPDNDALFIEDFSTPIFMQAGAVPFSLKLKNADTHFASPKAAILIKNIFGQTIGRIDIPKTNILSGTSRYLTSENSKQLSALNSQLSTPKVIWQEKFLLGLYTANLSIADENNKLLYTRNIHFLAFPYIFLAGFIVMVFVLIIFIKKIKKRLSE